MTSVLACSPLGCLSVCTARKALRYHSDGGARVHVCNPNRALLLDCVSCGVQQTEHLAFSGHSGSIHHCCSSDPGERRQAVEVVTGSENSERKLNPDGATVE